MVKVDEKMGITLTRGDNVVFALTLEDGKGNAYDYSSDRVFFGVKRSAFDGACVLETQVNEDGNIVITHDMTKSLDFGDYLYSVRLEHTNEDEALEIYTPIAGARFTLGFDIIRELPAVEESEESEETNESNETSGTDENAGENAGGNGEG